MSASLLLPPAHSFSSNPFFPLRSPRLRQPLPSPVSPHSLRPPASPLFGIEETDDVSPKRPPSATESTDPSPLDPLYLPLLPRDDPGSDSSRPSDSPTATSTRPPPSLPSTLRTKLSSLRLRRVAKQQGPLASSPDMTQASSSSSRSADVSASAGKHFRPIDYDTHVQLDNFFGQTKVQKREQALRVREDGRMYYDSIEREEWTRLLCPSASPTFSRRSSGTSISIASSPGVQAARRVSLAAIGFAVVEDAELFAFGPPPTGRRSVSSPITSPMGLSFGPYSSMPSPLLLPRSASAETGRFPSAADGAAVRRTRPHRSHSAVQRANTITDRLPTPSVRAGGDPYKTVFARRKSLSTASAAKNPFSETLAGNDEEMVPPPEMSLPEAEGAAVRIQLPSHLPLERCKESRQAFDSAFQAVSHADVGGGGAKEAQPASILKAPGAAGPTRKRPSPLQLGTASSVFSMASEGADPPNVAFAHAKKKRRPSSMTLYASPWTPSHRRRSSLDVSSGRRDSLSSPRSLGPSGSPSADRPPVPSTQKAEILLGILPPITAVQRPKNLLAPSGLATGAEVYRDVDIPCASVRLDSDNEDDEVAPGGKEKRGWWRRRA